MRKLQDEILHIMQDKKEPYTELKGKYRDEEIRIAYNDLYHSKYISGVNPNVYVTSKGLEILTKGGFEKMTEDDNKIFEGSLKSFEYAKDGAKWAKYATYVGVIGIFVTIVLALGIELYHAYQPH